MPLKLIRRKGSEHLYIRGSVRGQTIFESTGTHVEEIAEAIRIKREAELLEASVFGKKSTVTFFEAAVSYMSAGGSLRFLGEEVNGRWTGLMGHFEKTKLATITQNDLNAAAEKLYPNASPDTRNRQCFTPFVAVWNHAVKNGWAEWRKWSRPKKPKGTLHRTRPKRAGTRPVDYGKAAEFVLAMSPAPAIVMTVLFYTGMRPIELFALDAAEINVEKRWISLGSSKTDEPRGIPIHEFLVPLLTQLVGRGNPLFRTPQGNAYPILEDGGGQMKTAINGARRRTGITDIAPYTARHTVSTQLVVNGVHPYIKDQILGHEADDMSRHYTHVPQQPLIDAINTLPVIGPWADAPWISDVRTYSRKLICWGRKSRKAREELLCKIRA
jgi:integrase/recombinase XerD